MYMCPVPESKARPVGSFVKFKRLYDWSRVPSGCSFHRFVVHKNGLSSTSASLTKRPCPGT
jgi:hypothetical protein